MNIKFSNFLKIFSYILIGLTILLLLSISYYSYNIDDLAYVLCLGLDLSDNNTLELTFQFAIPSKIAKSNNSSSASSDSEDVTIASVKCTDINNGITLMNSQLTKKITLSHCKTIIFSEKLARLGLDNYLYTLINDVETQPDANIFISKTTASHFIENTKPIIEKDPANYYKTFSLSSYYTGYTKEVTLKEFFSNLEDSTTEPSAILTAITQNNNSNTPASPSKPNEFVAGNTSINSEPHIENIGLAVFSNDKLIGELNSIETICNLIIHKKLTSCIITISSPFTNSNTIDLRLYQKKSPKIEVEMINGSPFIKTDIELIARITSMNNSSNYLEQSKLDEISEYANKYLENQMSKYLYKTSKEFKSDINNFGKYPIQKSLFINDWFSQNWLTNYQNSFFDVNFDINVLSSYMILDS